MNHLLNGKVVGILLTSEIINIKIVWCMCTFYVFKIDIRKSKMVFLIIIKCRARLKYLNYLLGFFVPKNDRKDLFL